MFKGEAPDVSRMWTDSAEEGKEAGLLQAVSWRLTNKMSVLLLMGRGGGGNKQQPQESSRVVVHKKCDRFFFLSAVLGDFSLAATLFLKDRNPGQGFSFT